MIDRSNHTLAYEIPLKRYVRDQICIPEGWDPGATRLEIPLLGRRSCVRIVVGPGDQRRVLRLFFTAAEIRTARRIIFAHSLLERHSVPTPRHLRITEDFAGRGAVLVEEVHIVGKVLSAISRTPQVVRALAETFAPLHSVRAPHHGDPTAPSRSSDASLFIRRFGHRAKELKGPSATSPTSAECRELMNWARAWKPTLKGIPKRSLIFSRPHPANVLITDEPEAHLLDIDTVMWGPPAKDLAQLHLQAFAEDPAGWTLFRDHHRRSISPEIAEEIETTLPFFEALYHLSVAAHASKRRQRARRGRCPQAESTLETVRGTHWDAALAIAREISPPGR